ncbi:histidine phosphatase family protein [Salidesulfovibrio brasiliensis]|uniref:histidine phosphatase family protein n=1 Tax=Salidesulfovibrio brasiliensis TaxID=221711 RepID=UPI0006CFB9BA|nr:histidine phosphatase family protein [Salidesulfovibrio brasiliensis]
MTRFLLMRHARTEWNSAKRIQGHTDISLSDEGRDQCAAWRKTLDARQIDRILTSPLGRTVETAQLVAGHRGVEHDTDPRLAEMNWGDWTGRDKAAMKADREAVRREQERGFDFRPPGGESRRELLDRVLVALADSARKHPGSTVLTVTHNGVLQALSRHMAGQKFLPGEPDPLLPYRLHLLEWDGIALRPLCMNMEL